MSASILLTHSLRKQTKNEVARRGLDGKEMQKKLLQCLLPGRETPVISFSGLTMSMMKAGGVCMSTSAKSATTVDSGTRVGVES